MSILFNLLNNYYPYVAMTSGFQLVSVGVRGLGGQGRLPLLACALKKKKKLIGCEVFLSKGKVVGYYRCGLTNVK